MKKKAVTDSIVQILQSIEKLQKKNKSLQHLFEFGKKNMKKNK